MELEQKIKPRKKFRLTLERRKTKTNEQQFTLSLSIQTSNLRSRKPLNQKLGHIVGLEQS